MTRTANPATELGFEVERFEWAAADRLEVGGRWFGLGGRRFVRPVLNLRAGGRRRRLIALLDHKPWMPGEDGAWVAAFAWRGEHVEISAARLEVAPDVVLDLPAPGEDAAGVVLHPRERKPRGGDDARPQAAAKTRENAPPRPTRAESSAAPTRAESPPAPVASPPPDAPRIPVVSPAEISATQERAAKAERDLAAAQDRAAVAAGDLAAMRRRLEILERLLDETKSRAELAERGLAQARKELADARMRGDAQARELEAARGELGRTRERAEAAERERDAAHEVAQAVEAELEAYGDVSDLRRRAETAEYELEAAQERLRHRQLPETILAARGVPARREPDWAGRIVGVVTLILIAIMAIAILKLLV